MQPFQASVEQLRMKCPRRPWTMVALGAAVLVLAWLVVNYPGRLEYYGSPESIAVYLRSKTHVGPPVTDVTAWFARQGVGTTYWRGDIPARSSYPPSAVAGGGYIQATIAKYGWPLTTSIEAFYIFDNADHLAEVNVRRTVVAL